MLNEYAEFLAGKAVVPTMRGVGDSPKMACHMFSYQADCTQFGLRAGSFGLYLNTGLGKTCCELEWSQYAAEYSNGKALILTPLAVARQIEAEGQRFGYKIRVIRNQDEAQEGINVCNYDRLNLLDPSAFGSVALDEAGIIKNFSGKTTMALTAAFSQHRWRMVATATPAPNDHTELGTQSEFLGVMPMNDMLVRWFINDSSDTGTWRLKGHGRNAFWDWIASWSRMADHPRDLGDDIDGFDLPPLRIIRHTAEDSLHAGEDGTLFGLYNVSATGIHDLKRQTIAARADVVVKIAERGIDGPFLVWCDTDYEADALKDALKPIYGSQLAEVRGSMPIERKEDALARFAGGDAACLVTKPSVCGWGLNWQHVSTMAFAGRSFSYEAWYQAIRRCWRFGQKRDVTIHLVVAEGEDSIGRVIDRKADDHDSMKAEMKAAMKRAIGIGSQVRRKYTPTHQGRMPSWLTA